MMKWVICLLLSIQAGSVMAKGLPQLQCDNAKQFKAWLSKTQNQVKKAKYKNKEIKKLYLGQELEGQIVTLFAPSIFEGKITLSGTVIDCHDNLLNALRPKVTKKNRKTFLDLWEKCSLRLYETKKLPLVSKAVTCMKK